MADRLAPLCSAAQIAAVHSAGLRIVWDENGQRVTWEVLAVDDISATTRVTDAAGAQTERSATFEELSSHSAFPAGATLVREEFATPAGSFLGTHVTVAGPDGDQEFFFADDYPGPPMIISTPGFRSQQIQRSDL